MKTYQSKNEELWIEKPLFMQTIYFIRSYYIMKERYNDILNESKSPQTDGQPHGTGISDPTSQKAQKLERLHDDIKIIEDGLKLIPEQHRDIVWANVMFNKSYKEIGVKADRTYSRWKGRFVHYVAKEKKII